MDIQALVNAMIAQAQLVRAATQMTLGKMIDRLGELPAGLMMDGLCYPHSYRGYYCDLAFERCGFQRTVADNLAMLKDCIGKEFEGYKGGDFYMNEDTPVWFASYGTCGVRIMRVNDNGIIETEEDEPMW